MATRNRAGKDLGPAQRYAQFAADLSWDTVPESVKERALLSILDALGVGLAATSFPFAQVTRNAIVELGGTGDYPVLGMADRLPLRDAVLLNGTLIHGLDFDDTHSASIVHGSASAVPLVIGVGQAQNATGKQLLAAYLVAMEAVARIGRVARGGFQAGGFHPTGIVGAFGATLAAAALKGLTQRQTVHAQGITLSFASGSLEFLTGGAWTKRIHPGWAAVAGITATTLAAHGFVGPEAPYDGRYGLYNAFLGEDPDRDLDLAIAELGETWEMEAVAIKPYPACHFNHAFADSVLALKRKHGLHADDIQSMTAFIHPDQVSVVCEPVAAKRRPVSDYDAKFSVQFVMAAAMERGRFTLDELEDEALEDARILALCDRVDYQPSNASLYPRYYSGEVVIHTRDGRELEHSEPINRGADERPLSAAEVEEKFMSNASRVLPTDQAAALGETIMGLPDASSVDELMARLTPG